MYVIKSDGEIVYSPNLIQHGYAIGNGKITQELNKAGSLEFTLPKTNPMYSKMLKLKSIITVEDDGEEIWRGRILDTTTDFYNNRKFVCEGELAFLNDAAMTPYDHSSGISLTDYFKELIDQYERASSSYRLIRAGTVNCEDPNKLLYVKNDEYSDILSELTNNIINVLGGYLILRRLNGITYLDYYEKLEESIDQVVLFGKNLLDFQEYINAENVYSYLIPQGARQDDGNRVMIYSVNNNVGHLESPAAVELFGIIWKTIIWENITDPQTLLDEAKKTLEDGVKAATTITINAVDLKKLGVDCSRIKLGYQVPVISVPHEVNSKFLCSKLVISLEDISQNEYTLGLEYSSLTDKEASTFKRTESNYQVANFAYWSSTIDSNNLSSYKEITNKTISDLTERIERLEGGNI